MVTWGALRTQVRRTVLKDTTPDEETGAFRWSDEELLDCCWWALDTFSTHTAVASSTSYDLTGEAVFTLPGNLFIPETFDATGTVVLVTTEATAFLDPIRQSDLLALRDPYSYGFYTRYPENNYQLTIRLERIPTSGTLTCHYYAHYTRPLNDNSVIEIPRWSEGAVSHLIGAYALSGASLKTSFIRQYNARPDTGTPEHNPVRLQQEWFMRVYDRELQRYTPQVRVTAVRNDRRG